MNLIKIYFPSERLQPAGAGKLGAAGDHRSYMCAPGHGLSGDPGWEMVPDYRRRVVLCRRPDGSRTVAVPFDACIMEFDGIVPISEQNPKK